MGGTEMSEWLVIIRDFGFPGALLIFVGLCIWRGGRWLGGNIITPLKDRHVAFIDAMEISQKAIGNSIMDLNKSFANHDEWERSLATERNDVLFTIRSLDDRLFKIESERNK